MLIVFLAQKSKHIVEACRRKKGHISPSERDHVWMGAAKKDVLLILYITSIAQVTSREAIVSPGHSFSLKGVGTKSEASNACVNNVTRKIKEHVSRKGVWRMCDQGPLSREGAPLMVSGAFAIALSLRFWFWLAFRFWWKAKL